MASSMSARIPPKPKVAVIGLGVAGLAAVKNLTEQHFDVTGFDRNNHVGGLWTFTEDPRQLSVLRTTQTNTSKQVSVYQDYPMPNDYPDYPMAAQIETYMKSYAEVNGILARSKLGVDVVNVRMNGREGEGWIVEYRKRTRWAGNADIRSPVVHPFGNSAIGEDSTTEETFDRVLVCTGPFTVPNVPAYPGLSSFSGQVIHSHAYKGPDAYRGKKVVVVGMGNTGCDIAVDLAGKAEKVYLSHRVGGRIISRWLKGKPADHAMSRRRVQMGLAVKHALPAGLTAWGADLAMSKMMTSRFAIKPEWGLLPAPPIAASPGAVNETLVDRLTDGSIISVGGLRRFETSGVVFWPIARSLQEGKRVEGNERREDAEGEGELVEADVVILATSAKFDYSILAPEADPTKHFASPNHPHDAYESSVSSSDLAIPQLYMTLFPPSSLSSSLAFIGPCRGFTIAAFSNADLSSQAIAQVWAGNFALPPQSEMQAWCEKNRRENEALGRLWRLQKTAMDPLEFERWLNEAAGNGVNDAIRQGGSWNPFAKKDLMYGLMMDGLNTPAFYRLYKGRKGARKRWDGAAAEILRVNGMAQ